MVSLIISREYLALVVILLPFIPAALIAWIYTGKSNVLPWKKPPKK